MASLRHNGDGAGTVREPRDGYLDAARDCILDVGWRRTTLTEVAKRAGVSRMTIYRTWADMPTLLKWAGEKGLGDRDALAHPGGIFFHEFVGAVLEFHANVGLNGRVQQPFPGVFNGGFEMGRPIAGLFEDVAFQIRDRLFRIEFDVEKQNFFLFTATNGEQRCSMHGPQT